MDFGIAFGVFFVFSLAGGSCYGIDKCIKSKNVQENDT